MRHKLRDAIAFLRSDWPDLEIRVNTKYLLLFALGLSVLAVGIELAPAEVDTVIVVWTLLAAMTTPFSAAMMLTRNRNLRALLRSKGNGDREYRIFLARQDIRRSVIRYVANLMALTVGVLLWAVQTGHLEQYRHLVRHWPWILVAMLALIFLNEVWDRWALHHLREMYERQGPRS